MVAEELDLLATFVEALRDKPCTWCGRISARSLVRHDFPDTWTVWCGLCVRGADDPIEEYRARFEGRSLEALVREVRANRERRSDAVARAVAVIEAAFGPCEVVE